MALPTRRKVLSAELLTEELADDQAWLDDPGKAATAREHAKAVLDAWERMPSGFNVERVEGRGAPGQDPGGEYTLIDCRRRGPHLVVAQVARRLIGVQKVTWTMRQLADVEMAEAFAALMALVVADAKRRQG